MIDVEKFQISPYPSCGEIFPPDRCGEFQISLNPCSGEIWNFSSCGVISYFSTSVMWRNLKCLHMSDVENLRFIFICHREKSEMSPHDRCGEFKIYLHLSCIEIWNFSTWHIFLHISHMWYMWQISGMVLKGVKIGLNLPKKGGKTWQIFIFYEEKGVWGRFSNTILEL